MPVISYQNKGLWIIFLVLFTTKIDMLTVVIIGDSFFACFEHVYNFTIQLMILFFPMMSFEAQIKETFHIELSILRLKTHFHLLFRTCKCFRFCFVFPRSYLHSDNESLP